MSDERNEARDALEKARSRMMSDMVIEFEASLPPADDPLVDEEARGALIREFERRLRENFDEVFDSKMVTTEVDGSVAIAGVWEVRGSKVAAALQRGLAAARELEEDPGELEEDPGELGGPKWEPPVEEVLSGSALFNALRAALDEARAKDVIMKAMAVFGKLRLMGRNVGAGRSVLTVLRREGLLHEMESSTREWFEAAAGKSGAPENLN